MDLSTPLNHRTTRSANEDPELESPILAIAPGGVLVDRLGTTRGSSFNDSTDGESYQDRNGGLVM